jgi:3-oxoadipate enol-lactonase
MKNIKIDGLNINDYEKDRNKSLILVHAFPMDSKMWEPQVAYFKDKIRIITYDLRGFGQSEKNEGNYTSDSHADDLLKIIRSLELREPVICGLSLGGYIALRTLEKYPDTFKGAILCDTKSEADTNEAKLKRAEQIKMIKSGGRESFNESFIKAALSTNTINNENKSIMKRVQEIINEQNDFSVCTSLMTLAARTESTPFLEKIKFPVLIIVGVDDKLTPPENSRSMHNKIQNSEIVNIESAGHFTNLENPGQFNKSIESFINELNGK